MKSKEGIVVVSLFDGMACGLTALKRAGIKVKEYHAFEIDKYAIQIAKKNHPEIIHHGEINFMTNFSYFKGADLLIGGSPCQGFSFAGKQLNFNDPRSVLFFEFVRAKKDIKPRFFLLENVKMKKEFQDIISENMGVEPESINSALLSAQNRKRLYWANWHIPQPEDKGVLLKDIIEQNVTGFDIKSPENYLPSEISSDFIDPYNKKNLKGDKSTTLRMNSSNGNMWIADRDKSHLVFTGGAIRGRYNENGKVEQKLKIQETGEANCLTSVQKDSVLSDGITFRKLTPVECERLQTLPDNYTGGVSNTQRYRMLGNGWTVDVITHIFNQIKEVL